MKAEDQLKSLRVLRAPDKLKVTLYDARRILGKDLSSEFSDKDLIRLVSDLSHLVECIMERQSVPQSDKA